jgi:hypothetical protein
MIGDYVCKYCFENTRFRHTITSTTLASLRQVKCIFSLKRETATTLGRKLSILNTYLSHPKVGQGWDTVET